jgi:hypothetical protein
VAKISLRGIEFYPEKIVGSLIRATLDQDITFIVERVVGKF